MLHSTRDSQYVIKYLLIILILLSVFAFTYETVEHMGEGNLLTNSDYFNEVIFHAFIIPILGFVLLILQKKQTSDQQNAVKRLDQQISCSRELSRVNRWDELVNQIFQIIQNIAPTQQIDLWVLDLMSSKMVKTRSWSPNPADQDNRHSCDYCFLKQDLPEQDGAREQTCDLKFDPGINQNAGFYCLPMFCSGVIIGVIQWTIAPDYNLEREQVQYFNNLGPVFAMAIYGFNLRTVLTLKNQVNANERKQISHDLHDILGQDLAYLKYKLEALEKNESLAIHNDLVRMCEIAEEAYGVVRGTLISLAYSEKSDLAAIFMELAEVCQIRSNFIIKIQSIGTSQPLEASIQRQLIYVFREILTNIEKHASASHVNVMLDWKDQQINFVVQDDGVGFEPDEENKPGHFGLNIIRERIQKVDGNVEIISRIGQGTRITVIVPLAKSDLTDLDAQSLINNYTIR